MRRVFNAEGYRQQALTQYGDSLFNLTDDDGYYYYYRDHLGTTRAVRNLTKRVTVQRRGYAGIELPNNIGIISIKDNNLIAFAGVTGVVLISIFDYSGQCVLQTRDTTIDVSRLPEGIYILQALTSDGQVLQDKFIREK